MSQTNFSCCCSISPETFQTDGKLAVAVVMCIWAVLVSVSATLGNALVLVSFWKTPSLLTPANVLLISLAMTDLGTGVIAAPLFFVVNLAKATEDDRLFCKATPPFVLTASCLSGISLLTLTSISVERYTALIVHLRYNEMVTMRRVCFVTASMWLLCIATSVAAAIWTFALIDFASVALIPLCLVTNAFCYWKIHRVVRRHQAQISAQLPGKLGQESDENSFNMKKFKRSFVDMLIIYLVFIIQFTPHLVISFIIVAFSGTVSVYIAAGLAEGLILMNATLNPVLYCWRSRDIRSAVKETAQKLFCKTAT